MPWRWLYYEGIMDSSGHGQFRGGIGTHCEYLNEHAPETYRYGDSHIQTGNSGGEKSHPPGLLGGTAGEENRMWIRRKGELMTLHTKDIQSSEPGDVLITKSGGGGGVGNPVDRDVDKVDWDVLNEYISVERAREVYKVVVDPKTFQVDYDATNKLRGKG